MTLPADVTARAVDAALAVAGRQGLRVREPRLLSDGSNVLVHLRPAPVVARVVTTTGLIGHGEESLRREIAVAAFLGERGLPVVGPSAEIEPGPHREDGFALSFQRYVEVLPERAPEMAEVSASLAELHRALAEFPDELPFLAPALAEVEEGIRSLRRIGGLGEEDLTLLEEAMRRVEQGVRACGDGGQALHGDAHPGNVLMTASGGLWSDFEDACRGPVTWDVATLARSSAFAVEEVLRAYPEEIRVEDLEPFILARELQGTVWVAILATRFAEARERVDAYLERWRDRAD